MTTTVPDLYYEFDGWTGSFLASANPLSLVATSNIELTGHFRPITYSDDFETGNLQKLGWSTGGDLPWVVQSGTVLAGSFSAQSGAIGDSQTSSLSLTTNFGGGLASFYFKVSSEPAWDFLNFYLDGVLQQQWSGDVDWTSYSFPLSYGTHTLEWRYTKDPELSMGLDAAFLDNVSLPFGLPIDVTTPARLQMTQQADGSLLLLVQGQANRQYVIQGATDLKPPISWQNLSTNIATAGVISYPVTDSSTIPYRFYRAITQ